jgi:hypothetical protein
MDVVFAVLMVLLMAAVLVTAVVVGESDRKVVFAVVARRDF